MIHKNDQHQNHYSQKHGGRVSGLFAFLLTFAFALTFSQGAFAQGVDNIVSNLLDSGRFMPTLGSVTVYILGLAFGLMGVVKIKEHVDNPQTPMRTGIIRLIIGGLFLSFPTAYEAMASSIDGGFPTFFSFFADNTADAGTSVHQTGGFNGILANIIGAITNIPTLFSLMAYLGSILFGIQGLLKVKAHVENPDQNPLKDAIIKLIIGGALAAIPFVYNAMAETLAGPSDAANIALGGFTDSDYGKGCGETTAGTLGTVICTLMGHVDSFPSFLDAIAYLFGLLMGFWGLLKIKEHVTNPQNTPLSQGISRLAAGGAFFTLPYVVNAIKNSISPGTTVELATEFNSGTATCGGGGGLGGLDNYIYCAVSNIIGPIHLMTGFFAMVAGIIFIMIGISRLLKTEQDGPKGPSGMGTIMTFIIGGVLISFNNFIGILSTTLFSDSVSKTSSKLEYTTGMKAEEIAHAEMVIGAIIQFMVIIGLISFARGIFIIRGVAEGDNQSSMMAGVTHILGGALAFNLGPLMNAVQVTLGITEFGITFS